MSILRIEPFSGVSGDLFAGALAQLAGGEALLSGLPARLGFEGVRTQWETVDKCGISCRKVSFVDAQAGERKRHRHLSDIVSLINAAELPEGARKRALDIFQRLGKAEAAVHGIALERVHFHEVGAIDSILDIVSAGLLLDQLDVEQTYSDPVVTGKGMVGMAHGNYPIPAPATHRLLEGMVVVPGAVEGELTTPTGAAILQHLEPSFRVPPLRVKKTGMAGASKNFEHPNILRLSLCETVLGERELILIQTNIDDMPGEYLGSELMDTLLKAGARDAWTTAIRMKQGRPGMLLEVLCDPEKKEGLSRILYETTSTIGLRYLVVTRSELERKAVGIETECGIVAGKEVELPTGKKRVTPEYKDCLRIGKATGRPAYEIYQMALKGIGK